MTENKIKITLIGQQQFGADVYKRLKEQPYIEIVGVSAPEENNKTDPLFIAVQKDSLFCVDTKLFKDPNTQSQWKNLNADVNVMAFVTEIIPQEVLDYPKFGSIQYHPSLLPLHRGISSINWAVIKGDKETGISIFWVDKFIDHGPILIQEKIPIGPDDTVKSIYFGKLYPMGVDALVRSVKNDS